MMPLVFELIALLALFALGFVSGRIWQIRQEEVRRRSHQLDEEPGFKISTARLPIPLN
jgi:hypothetical protein